MVEHRTARDRAHVPRGLLQACAIAAGVMAVLFLQSPAPAHAQEQAGYAAGMKAGRAAYNANDMATAERHFDAAQKAAENDRQKGSAIYALGVVAQKQNKLPEAKKHAEAALALNANDAQAKGLLDEVNAASTQPGKGKAKSGASKGLAKTPLAPPNKKAAAAASATVAPAAGASTAATGAIAPGQADAPKPKPKPKADVKTAKPAVAKSEDGKTGEAPALPPTKPPAKAKAAKPAVPAVPPADAPAAPTAPGKSGALPEKAAPDRVADAPLAAPTAQAPTAAPVSALDAVPAAPAVPAAAITTGSLAAVPPANPGPAVIAAVAPTPAAVAPGVTAPLPSRARYIEMACGQDYRAEGRTFARAFEITRAGNGSAGGDTEVGEILTFEVACEAASGTASKAAPVPRTLIPAAKDGAIVRTVLRRAPEGGWTYAHPQGHRQVRIRLGEDTLTVVPPATEVAVLRKKLAENPAQLEALTPRDRQNFEATVSGDGYPEFRAVRYDDGLDTVFAQASKAARRLDPPSTAATASARTN